MARARLRYYGISPWEAEVLYGYFGSRFDVLQEEIEPDEPGFVSKLEVHIPVDFSEEFFGWFDYRRWEKVKGLLKEMKRRRGSGNAIRVRLIFRGTPDVTFVADSRERQWFDNSIEKIDFVLELLPYHMEKLPASCTAVWYAFDTKVVRWRLHRARAGGKKYAFREGAWSVEDG